MALIVVCANPILKHFDQRAIQTSRQSKQETLAMLNPQTFLTLANPLRKYAAEKHRRVKRTLFQNGVFQDLPYLKIEETKEENVYKVIGHEGRHRTTYLPLLYKESTTNKMPVRFLGIGFDISTLFGKIVTVEAQMGTKRLQIKM